MDQKRVTNWSRRRVGQVTGYLTLAPLLGLGSVEQAEAKQQCRKLGAPCKKHGKRCKAKFCLSAPLTIEVQWANSDSDHNSFLFVPNEAGVSEPFPFITVSTRACRGDGGNDGSLYPFATIDRDAQGPGN